uniref:Uncharacterized protein n=1 Tax=Timema douglasi TaxID=61478 RepID=A0A7R8Z9G9_TIMDO|nr:unnamed protein product [Timema douglasi]
MGNGNFGPVGRLGDSLLLGITKSGTTAGTPLSGLEICGGALFGWLPVELAVGSSDGTPVRSSDRLCGPEKCLRGPDADHGPPFGDHCSRTLFRVLAGKPNGMRRRWEDSIRMDLKEIGCNEGTVGQASSNREERHTEKIEERERENKKERNIEYNQTDQRSTTPH